ncbi:uncharacterized protein K444DRAFT_363253 [Hyaloscypha bicolor E]|uniref:Uncharacterized protein n=1 Tax=Hyaloscypha bicolor E TaxID=1095630 RepID=A0A2J6TGN2_9HELO|nr:uncharacterized protein K444DRAFT_363253 [Hyaloscypha bicolor E]PMD62170.1 hypothetical protein K444DRAFT_363253 [Hyaloscypha bicolor E]
MAVPREPLHCSWPLKFFETRPNSDRALENQPYIDWVKECVSDSWGAGDDSHDEDDSEWTSDEDGESEWSKASELSSGAEDHTAEEPSLDLEDSESVVCYDQKSTVRLFKEGEGEELLPYRDQVDVVAGFCEMDGTNPDNTRRDNPVEGSVVLLGESGKAEKAHSKYGQYRCYRGPMTSQQLKSELSRKRFCNSSERNNRRDFDVERRLIFITHLDASTVETLAATASRSQAFAFKNLFYKHLAGRASIGVAIHLRGLMTYNLELHIPFYVLKGGFRPVQDPRKGHDGW